MFSTLFLSIFISMPIAEIFFIFLCKDNIKTPYINNFKDLPNL
ncbi:hypothetical protein PHG01_00086 [Streptococcus mutans PKUSS-HG01]|nr:hypothetical protein PLG01_00087 [Streptococcus mutans PKUSS-LG01]ESS19563.1 hypothetical protein PHG01_00086 [Streptococcus mutans PKUSS-HG01]